MRGVSAAVLALAVACAQVDGRESSRLGPQDGTDGTADASSGAIDAGAAGTAGTSASGGGGGASGGAGQPSGNAGRDATTAEFDAGGAASIDDFDAGATDSGIPKTYEVWVGDMVPGILWPSGGFAPPTAVVLVLDRSSPAGPSGVITFGDQPPPAPPTHADGFYPPLGSNGGFWYGLLQIPHEGVEYTLLNAHLRGKRLTFDVSPSELYRAWCAMQTSYPGNDGQYHCDPPGAPKNGTLSPNPLHGDLCLPDDDSPRVCQCNESLCAFTDDYFLNTFELAFDGDSAVGERFGVQSTLRLSRVE